MLGYEIRLEVHALLKEHDVTLDYGVEDLEHDMATLRSLQPNQTENAAWSSFQTPASIEGQRPDIYQPRAQP